MKIGNIDYDKRCEYIILYMDKRDDTFNTWTLQESGLRVNYEQMCDNKDVEILGVYKKMKSNDIPKLHTK